MKSRDTWGLILLVSVVVGTVVSGSFISVKQVLAAAPEQSNWQRLLDLDELWWFGLDFTEAQFIGPEGFRQPEQIFPAHLDEWNERFLSDGPARELAGRHSTVLQTRTAVVESGNHRLDASAIVEELQRPNGIPLATIAERVSAYQGLPEKGTGLVVLVDRLDHPHEMGCSHWVYFDIESREVLDAPRFCDETGGFGFVARWLSPVKGTVDRIPQLRKEWRKAARKAKSGKPSGLETDRLMSQYW